MAYKPPAGESLDFDFTQSGYVAPSQPDFTFSGIYGAPDAGAVNFNFTLSGYVAPAELDFNFGTIIYTGTGSYTPPDASSIVFDFIDSGYVPSTAPSFNFGIGTTPVEPPVEPPGEPDNVVTFTATIGELSAAFAVVNFPPVQRLTVGKVCVAQDNSTASIDGAHKSSVDNAERKDHKTLITFEPASKIDLKVDMTVENTRPISIKASSEQEGGELIDARNCSIQDQLTPLPDELGIVLEDTAPVGIKSTSVQDVLEFTQFATCYPVDNAGESQFNFTREFYITPPVELIYTPSRDIDLQYSSSANTIVAPTQAYATGDVPVNVDFLLNVYTPPVSPVFDFNIKPTVGFTFYDHGLSPWGPHDELDYSTPYTSTQTSVATDNQLGLIKHRNCSPIEISLPTDIKSCFPVDEAQYPPPGETPWVDDPRPDPDPDPPGGGGGTLVVPTQEVYRMQNTINVTLDDDLTVLTMGKIALSLDADSHTWKFSGDLLDPADVTLVKQATDGTPVELHITINAYVWHVIVERTSTNRKFGSKAVSISGRGLSGLLSKPYRQPASVNFGALLTVQQIADNVLPAGWSNTWSTVTWNVDGGAYSYNQKTPIDALKEIADNIGAMIVPHPSTKVLEFKPRYPVLPWDFAGTAVDVQIPDSAITELTEEPIANYQGNGVYIHGDEIGGELAFVRLSGTAGDRLLDTVNNALMTDVIGLRALGERKLASQASQPSVKSVTTFMDGTIVPFVNVGTFVGLDVNGVVEKGIVNAVSINVSHATVEQTLSIGESTPNAWVAFAEILPKDPMLVATLSSTDGVTSLMLMLDGGIVRVRGTGTVNNKYYIRSGEIVGDAPNQTLSNIVV